MHLLQIRTQCHIHAFFEVLWSQMKSLRIHLMKKLSAVLEWYRTKCLQKWGKGDICVFWNRWMAATTSTCCPWLNMGWVYAHGPDFMGANGLQYTCTEKPWYPSKDMWYRQTWTQLLRTRKTRFPDSMVVQTTQWQLCCLSPHDTDCHLMTPTPFTKTHKQFSLTGKAAKSNIATVFI